MQYRDFEKTMSTARMSRYLSACGNNTKKAMTLYRKNLKLSQETFTIISCMEISLRNAIDEHYLHTLGSDWLRNAATTGGIFDIRSCINAKQIINETVSKLGHYYSHHKLVAELGFGFWRYLFAPHQFAAARRTLLAVFPSKPRSTPNTQYNNAFIFSQLALVNDIRNRIAHHEPICFVPGRAVKDTIYARQHYNLILQLFQWMNIDAAQLLYGLDHITTVCNEIDSL